MLAAFRPRHPGITLQPLSSLKVEGLGAEIGPLMMIAGGIGVTPFASQLGSAAARGESRDVHVVYVPSRPGEVLYRDVLESAGATVTVLDDTPVTADALLTAVPDLASRRAYVSGAPSLVADAATALRRAGARRVRTDYFAGY